MLAFDRRHLEIVSPNQKKNNLFILCCFFKFVNADNLTMYIVQSETHANFMHLIFLISKILFNIGIVCAPELTSTLRFHLYILFPFYSLSLVVCARVYLCCVNSPFKMKWQQCQSNYRLI